MKLASIYFGQSQDLCMESQSNDSSDIRMIVFMEMNAREHH